MRRSTGPAARPTSSAATTRSRKLAEALRERGVLDDARDEKIRSRATKRVTQAYEFARESPLPDPAEALEHVFV